VVRFGETELPVKLYAAVEDRKVHFHLLAPESRKRVSQRMVDPESGGEVPFEEIRKGFELDEGKLVVLDDEELESIRPEPSRTIEVTRFVPPGEIDHRWYERPYYLGPDGDADDYFAFAEALAKAEREGVARWVMRNKAYAGALHARDGYLMLITLRHSDEVISASELEPPGGPSLDKRELEMAKKLVAAYEDDFRPAVYHDEYRERVTELVESKAKGKVLEMPKAEPRRETGDSLAEALEASLAAARKGGAKKAGAKAASKPRAKQGKARNKSSGSGAPRAGSSKTAKGANRKTGAAKKGAGRESGTGKGKGKGKGKAKAKTGRKGGKRG
jgi:DNA end-binding protein Ku